MDLLEQFRDSRGEDGNDVEDASVERVLLSFSFGDLTFAVPATKVDAVVTWRAPSPLPAAVPGFAGVVQDRGRIVAVLETPLGRGPGKSAGRVPRRLVICGTTRGFLGLPAEETKAVATVLLASRPSHGEMVDSKAGALLYVDPEAVLQELNQ